MKISHRPRTWSVFRNRIYGKLGVCGLSLGLLLFTQQTGSAVVLASEDFTYASGILADAANDGGQGWSGAWMGSAVPEVLSTVNLSYTAVGYDVTQTGTGQIYSFYSSGDGVSSRLLAQPVLGTEGGTEVWFSILLRVGGTSVNDSGRTGLYFNVAGTSRSTADAGFLLVGETFRTLSDGTLAGTGPTLALNTTHLVVGRVSLLETGSSTISLWLDPTNVTDPASLGAPSISYSADFGGSITSVGIEAYGQGTAAAIGMSDAFRLGTTLNSVTVPEPNALSMMIGASLLGLVWRRGGRR